MAACLSEAPARCKLRVLSRAEERSMVEIDARLREAVHLLGKQLGETIRDQHGDAFLAKIESIRQGSKAARQGSPAGDRQLRETLGRLSDDELLPVARAFSQFLNLANIAEQHHRIRRRHADEEPPFETR